MAKYLFPKFNDNDWGDEDPTDSSIIDPNNVSKRIKPTSTKDKMGLFDLLDFSLLERYSDILEDYYGRDYDEHFERFNSDDGGLKFDDNKTAAEDSNGKSDNGESSSSLNNQSDVASSNPLNNQSKTKNSISAGVKSDNVNSTYVSENSNNRKMVELFEDNPISQKSFDIRYILALTIVLLVFFVGLLRKRDRSN